MTRRSDQRTARGARQRSDAGADPLAHIDRARLARRLEQHALGYSRLQPTQLRAIELLLRNTAPDRTRRAAAEPVQETREDPLAEFVGDYLDP